VTVQDDMDRLERELRDLWLKVAAALHLEELAAWLNRRLERKP
jgi:hypothetical protein